MSTPKILVVAGDAGGANALWPVFSLLRGAGAEPVLAGYAVAPGLWRAKGESVLELADGTSEADALALLRETGAGLLLAGTSVNGTDLERRFIRAARQAGVPSLSLLDFWANYAPRFAGQGQSLDCLPDAIAVMDRQAHEEMREAGFPEAVLVVTGQPLLDSLQSCRAEFTPQARQELRQRVGLAAGHALILFAGQPLNDVHRERGARAVLGYDEGDVLPLVADTLERLRGEKPLRLVLLPHPREPRDKYLPLLAGRPWAQLAPEGLASRKLVLAADLVIGMNSMLLLESVLLGTAALSVQPNLRCADPLPVSRNGTIPRIEQPGELEGAVRLLLEPQARTNQHLPMPGDAAAKVAALALGMLRGGTCAAAGAGG